MLDTEKNSISNKMLDTVNSPSNIEEAKEKPLLIVHRIPSNTCFFRQRLATNFTLLEPIDTVGIDSSAIQSYLRINGSGARALVCVWASPLRKDILDCLPCLEVVVVACAGYNHVDLSECRRRGIAVTNVGEVLSDDVADYAVAMLLDVVRKVSAADRLLRSGVWPRPGEFSIGSSIRGKQIGIVGLGSIGTMIANRLIAFGCNIAYNSRHKKSSVSYPYYANVYDLALDSDILILCCSLTEQTHHIIDKKVLTALGKDGYVINVGRGALIDESELVQSLVDGRIGGAGLDVFEFEPNISKELFGLENVVLSPHQAALTPQSFKGVEDIVMANLEAFFSNKPLITPVSLE